jgi:hypothetical protein
MMTQTQHKRTGLADWVNKSLKEHGYTTVEAVRLIDNILAYRKLSDRLVDEEYWGQNDAAN